MANEINTNEKEGTRNIEPTTASHSANFTLDIQRCCRYTFRNALSLSFFLSVYEHVYVYTVYTMDTFMGDRWIQALHEIISKSIFFVSLTHIWQD